MTQHVLRVVAATLALLPALSVAASLTLDQSLDLAVQRSESIRAARLAHASASELTRAADQLPDPMLSAGVDNLPATGAARFSTTAEGMTMKRIGLTQEWVRADKRAARRHLALAVENAQALAVRVAHSDIRLQTALAFVDVHYAEAAFTLAAQNVSHAKEQHAAGKGRLATLAGSSADVLGLVSALGQAEDEVAESQQALASARASLLRWTGSPVDETVVPVLRSAASEDEFVSVHPQVLLRQQELEVVRGEVEAVRLNSTPNWTWEVSYGQRQGASDLVSVGVSIPLPVARAARQDRETAAKLALVDKAQADLTEARRSAGAEFAVLQSDAKRLADRARRFEEVVLTPARQRTELALASYRSNQVSLTAVFEARHDELEARRKLLGLQKELAKTQAQLAFKPVVGGAL